MPVVFGPNYNKFQEAVELIQQGGAIPIHNYNDFEQTINQMLVNKKILHEKGNIASKYVKQKAGATQKILTSIEKSMI
jgi:3-deoxy-D-manno-octulosonic-acid transferase